MQIKVSINRPIYTRENIQKHKDWLSYLLAPHEKKVLHRQLPKLLDKCIYYVSYFWIGTLIASFIWFGLDYLKVPMPDWMSEIILDLFIFSFLLLLGFGLFLKISYPDKEIPFEQWRKMKHKK